MTQTSSSYYKTVSKCLTESYVGPGETTTHVSMGEKKGRYYIGNNEVGSTFIDAYCDAIFHQDVSVASMGIAESALPEVSYSPGRVDIDLEMVYKKNKLPTSIYTQEQVGTLIELYFKVFNEITLNGVQSNDQLCFYMAKDSPKRKNPDVITQGFHLHFPNIYLRNGDQHVFLTPKVQAEIDAIGLFDGILESTTKSSECIDSRAAINAPWLMYGSGKGDGRFYKIKGIYNGSLDELDMKDALDMIQLKDVNGELLNINKDPMWYAPMVLSISPLNKHVYELNAAAYESVQYKGKKKRQLPKNKEYEYDDPEKMLQDIKMASELMPMLSDDRSEEWEEWTKIGIYLYNICRGTEEGFQLWFEFSQRADGKRTRSEAECRKIFDGFYNIGIDVRALENLVRIDNIEGFRKYQQRNSHRCLLYLVSVKHYDVAMSLHELYPDEFVYTKEKTWYVYNNHGWEFAPEGMALRKLLSTELYDNHNELLKKVKASISNPGATSDNLEALVLSCENIQKILTSLKTTSFKNNVIKECTEVYYDPYFLSKLDSDPDLIRFNNGVFDFKDGVFRDGRPSDYISKTTGNDYKVYDPRNPQMQIVYNYIEQVFPDPTLYEYFLNFASEILRGFNFRKIFSVWTGDGDNSKSVMINLIEKILGEYMVKLPTSLVTGKRTQSSAASPEMIRTKGTKLAILQEPSKTDSLNAGIIKEYTGNDSFYCRGLYGEGDDITPLFKLIMICNDLPGNTDSDPAYWNRIRVVPFESVFTDQAPKDLNEQIKQKKFPKDPNFSKKLDGMIEPFTYILINKYMKIKNKNYFEPYKVTSATDIYKKNNDVFLQFIDDSIVADASTGIQLQEMYVVFKEWYKDSFPNKSVPTKNDLKEQITRRWKNNVSIKNGSAWSGYRLRNSQDDMNDMQKFKEEKEKEANMNSDEKENENGENDEDGDEGEGEDECKKKPTKKQKLRRPNTTIVLTHLIKGVKVRSTWLVGQDREVVGKTNPKLKQVTLITDRIGNPVKNNIVYNKETNEQIGTVIGEGVYAYISYTNEQDNSKKIKKKKIRKSNVKPGWDTDTIECAKLDYTVDSTLRNKIKKSVKNIMNGGKDDDDEKGKKGKKTKLLIKKPKEESRLEPDDSERSENDDYSE